MLIVQDLRCTCCAEAVLDAVRSLEGVGRAELDYQSAELLVELDAAVVDEERVREAVRRTGYRCEGDVAGATTGLLAHSAQLAPITCGTKHDRMQYELPHTRGQEQHHDPSHEAPHEGHGGMSHDMSDPRMAAAMERDMRNRFFVALVLTIPVVLLSPLAANTFGIELIDSMDARNWLMLALSAPIVWYAGWIFIGGAWTSLRQRSLNMSVLRRRHRARADHRPRATGAELEGPRPAAGRPGRRRARHRRGLSRAAHVRRLVAVLR
jgi:Cu2+-exporting ATPase